MAFRLKFTIFALVLGAIFLFPSVILAESCENEVCSSTNENYSTCLSNKQICLENKIAETKKEASTLKGEIQIFDGTIGVLRVQIDQNIYQISKLEKEINELGDRIDGLNLSLDKLTNVMVERVGEHYKRTYDTPLVLFFSQDRFSELLSEQKSLSMAKKQTLEAMEKAENMRLNYDEQKTTKEEKQLELEKKKKELNAKKRQLDEQRLAKQNLLNTTKNNEATYQRLLAQAKAEVAQLRRFALSKGDVRFLPPQNSPDGWFFSQRDERWAGMLIGNSDMNIYYVGCLVSSVSMIKKKFGEDVSPVSIAANSSFFTHPTANLNRPWPAPAGYRYEYVRFSQGKLDEELNKNPVIVKLLAGSYGTHFVVIKEKKDGGYLMHDPWEGYDKKFSDFYSMSQIAEIGFLTR